MSNVPRASREMGGLEKEEEEHGKDGRDVEVVSEESGGELFSGPLGEKALAHASESLSSRSTTSSEEDHSSLDGEEKGGFVKNHEPKDFSAGMEMMMKERFAKLLLGEDMSGCGKGVSTALTISNSITNLCATIFGQVWRLEPLPSEKKAMWKREMDWLLCVSDHIVELAPSWQTLADGRKLEVMACRPRADLFINLPALKKLDNILLEILDSFSEPEFWYIERGIVATMDSNDSSSICRQEEKWWLPVPQVPSGGLQEKSRKHLEHKRESVSQILKAVMAINSNILAEMDVPDSYLESLPKNGRTSLGDLIHRYITSDQFSPDCLLDCLDLSSEHQALEIANRVEAATFIWRRRAATRPPTNNPNRTTSRTSWGGVVRDFMGDVDKRELLAGRAESLLISLKQRFPRLSQTSLDTSKIQYNKDIGKSILESYSRVLESLAFNIVARIDELLHVDDVMKQPTTGDNNKLAIVPKMAAVVAHKRGTIPSAAAYSVPPSSTTPYATAYATPCFSPAPLGSLNRSPMANRRSNARGFGVKKVLTDYLGVDVKAKASVDHQQGRMKLRTNEDRGKVLPSN